jgi:hypothetical protein
VARTGQSPAPLSPEGVPTEALPTKKTLLYQATEPSAQQVTGRFFMYWTLVLRYDFPN